MTDTKRKAGRPPSANPLSATCRFRLTPAELELIVLAAYRAGITASEWVRRLSVRAAKRDAKE